MNDIPELPYMSAQADKLLSDVDTFLTLCEECFKDKGFSLEARWALYLKIEKLLPISKYITKSARFISQDDVYDNMFPDGRGSRLNSAIDEMIEESAEFLEEDLKSEDPYTVRYAETQQFMMNNRDAWREMVLAEGTSGLIFDW